MGAKGATTKGVIGAKGAASDSHRRDYYPDEIKKGFSKRGPCYAGVFFISFKRNVV
jgi:hypothetical protein